MLVTIGQQHPAHVTNITVTETVFFDLFIISYNWIFRRHQRKIIYLTIYWIYNWNTENLHSKNFEREFSSFDYRFQVSLLTLFSHFSYEIKGLSILRPAYALHMSVGVRFENHSVVRIFEYSLRKRKGGYSHFGDNVILWLYDGDSFMMLVAIHYVGDLFRHVCDFINACSRYNWNDSFVTFENAVTEYADFVASEALSKSSSWSRNF